MAGPISYTIDGQQYVTVEAGWGGAFPLALGGISTVAKVKPEARVLTYKIGGNAKLPAPDPSPDVLPPPPPVTADAATVNKGRDLYNGYCGMCHGPNAMSGGVIPDLRYLTPEKHKIFNGILAGASASKGMPPIIVVLKPADADAIHPSLIQRPPDLPAPKHGTTNTK